MAARTPKDPARESAEALEHLSKTMRAQEASARARAEAQHAVAVALRHEAEQEAEPEASIRKMHADAADQETVLSEREAKLHAVEARRAESQGHTAHQREKKD